MRERESSFIKVNGEKILKGQLIGVNVLGKKNEMKMENVFLFGNEKI